MHVEAIAMQPQQPEQDSSPERERKMGTIMGGRGGGSGEPSLAWLEIPERSVVC